MIVFWLKFPHLSDKELITFRRLMMYLAQCSTLILPLCIVFISTVGVVDMCFFLVMLSPVLCY